MGGIVVMRYGENALDVIDRVKAKLAELEPSLPQGVELEIAYDRSDLIDRAIGTLRDALVEEAIVVALVILAVPAPLPLARSCRSSRCRSRWRSSFIPMCAPRHPGDDHEPRRDRHRASAPRSTPRS